MVLSADRADASLLEFLARRARLASTRRLAADVAVGAVVLVSAGRLDSWLRLAVSMAAVCVIVYGGWGFVERARARLRSHRWPQVVGALDAVAALLAIGGVLAAILAILSVWALALGTWIS